MVTIAEHQLADAGHLAKGDILGIVAGTRTLTGSTNFLRLHVVGDQVIDTTVVAKEVREPAHA
jgi:pyruvate kinase